MVIDSGVLCAPSNILPGCDLSTKLVSVGFASAMDRY